MTMMKRRRRAAALAFPLLLAAQPDSVKAFAKTPTGTGAQTVRRHASSCLDASGASASWQGDDPVPNLSRGNERKSAPRVQTSASAGAPPITRSSGQSIPKAPLVDSTLLRFISKQKMDIVLPPPSTVGGGDIMPATIGEGDANGKTNVGRDEASLNTEDVVVGVDEMSRQIKNMEPHVPVATSLSYADSVWLGQYNANRIAQQLMAIGAEEDDSREAGQIVQRHALARTMRRRIRKFLRERDVMWAEGPTSLSESSSSLPNDAVASGSAAHKGGLNSIEEVLKLLTDAGLTGKDIAAVFSHTPSVATMAARRPSEDGNEEDEYGKKLSAKTGETLEETLDRAYNELLTRTLKLRRYDARKVLRTCPGLLTKRGSKSAEGVVKLMSSLGVSTSSIAREKTSLPSLLSRSPVALFRLVAFLSSDIVRMRTRNIGPLMRRRECADLLDLVAPPSIQHRDTSAKVDDVTFMEDFWGGRLEEQRKRVDEVYRNMAATTYALRNDIGVRDLASMVQASPDVLLLDVSSQVFPLMEFLEDIGIDEEGVATVIRLYPALIGADVPSMRKNVDYLRALDVSDEALGGIFRAFPSLLLLDLEKDMAPVVAFLREIGVVNIGRFVTRLPPILGYSVEKELIPKWEYLSRVCQYDYFEVVRFPAYFSYPLERVIKTRYEYLRDVKKLPISLVNVDDVVRFGDIDFAVSVAGDKDGGRSFVEYTKSRKRRCKPTGKGKKTRRGEVKAKRPNPNKKKSYTR